MALINREDFHELEKKTALLKKILLTSFFEWAGKRLLSKKTF